MAYFQPGLGSCVDIPGSIPLGFMLGKDRKNIKNLEQFTNCTIKVDTKRKKISISSKLEENIIEGMKEVKIFISKIAGITSPEMENTAYFLTKLKDRQQVEMVSYSKFKPSISQSWGSNHYVLQTQELGFSKEDAIHFRCTDLLKDHLGKVLLTYLSAESPASLKIEGRFGKVLWDLPNPGRNLVVPFSEIECGGGKVTLANFGLVSPYRHTFDSLISAETISLRHLEILGSETILMIQVVILKDQNPVDTEYPIINVKCRKEGKTYKLVEVIPKKRKDCTLDNIILEGSLDIRIICNFSTQKDIAVVQKYQEIGKMITDSLFEIENGELELVLRHKDAAVVYVARRKKTVYQYNYEGRPYLLTLVDSDECPDTLKVLKPDTKYQRNILEMKSKKAIILDNPQWLIDFAQLTKSQFNASVEEVFSWNSCRPPKGLKPKIPTVESVLEELDHFMGCALFLSINSTK